MTLDNIKDLLLIFNFITSLFIVRVQVKNSNLQRKSYLISSHNSRASSANLNYIDCKQFNDHFVVKLAFYNPSSTAAILRSLTVTKLKPHPNYILRKMGLSKESEIDFNWSPALDTNSYDVVLLRDAYHLLYVKDLAVLFISIPGYVNRDEYHFEIRTNHNYYKLSCNVDGFNHRFPINFQEWHND